MQWHFSITVKHLQTHLNLHSADRHSSRHFNNLCKCKRCVIYAALCVHMYTCSFISQSFKWIYSFVKLNSISNVSFIDLQTANKTKTHSAPRWMCGIFADFRQSAHLWQSFSVQQFNRLLSGDFCCPCGKKIKPGIYFFSHSCLTRAKSDNTDSW